MFFEACLPTSIFFQQFLDVHAAVFVGGRQDVQLVFALAVAPVDRVFAIECV